MISKQDLERVLSRTSNGGKVLSLFLDMSVNSDNKRTHNVFLNQRRAQFAELDSQRNEVSQDAVGEAFSRINEWLATEYREENRGVVIYTELGGEWFEALQFPVAVQNRLTINHKPSVRPLAQVLESYHHHGVVLLDREHLRILSIYLGTLLDQIEVNPDPIPTAHDVQAGGYSQMRFQRRKLEEMKHFFKDFAKHVEDFVNRHRPHDLVLLGTNENVAQFREFLSEPIQQKIIYTGPARVDESTSEVIARIEPHLQAEHERENQELLMALRDRVRQDYLATAGFQSTLTALQEGKVDRVVLAQDQERDGARCTTCGFVFAREVGTCPYDGSPTEEGVDVIEEVIRLAESQGAEVQFVSAGEVGDLAGIGALLRF